MKGGVSACVNEGRIGGGWEERLSRWSSCLNGELIASPFLHALERLGSKEKI